MKTLIKNGVIIDGTGSAPRKANLLFDETQILAITEETPEADRVIDATGKTVLPGFIDCHVHPGMLLNGDPISDTHMTYRGAIELVQSGITTFRSTGTANNADVKLRNLINEGKIDGPRIKAAGKVLCITCGHAESVGICVDTVGETLKAARSQCRERVDWLKFMPTSGVIGIGPATNIQLSKEQIDAIIAVGIAFDTPTCAHLMNYDALKLCVEAGLTCVEHGYDMDDSIAQEMVKRGTWYVPTAVVTLMEMTHIKPVDDVERQLVEKAAAAQKRVRNALKVAIRNGVKMGVGTDTGCPYTNPTTYAFATEMYLYSISGMDNMKVIEAATLQGAKLLGIDDITGSLEPGKCPDITIIDGDPIADIERCKYVDYTICKGKVLYHRLFDEVFTTPRR